MLLKRVERNRSAAFLAKKEEIESETGQRKRSGEEEKRSIRVINLSINAGREEERGEDRYTPN